MAETVSDEDNPMLLHKPKPKTSEPDIFGRDIPMDPKILEGCLVKQKGTAEKVFDRLTGRDGKLAPVVKIFLPGTKGTKEDHESDNPRGFGFFIGVKGTF